MLFWIKVITDVINIGLGCILLYLGSHILSSLRLSLQQSSIRLFLAAAALFTLHEALFFIPQQTEAIHITHELLQTGFIGCLCAAMWFIVKSQKSEISGLHRLADIDHLTGLENLTAFRRQALQLIQNSVGNSPGMPAGCSPLAVLMIDIDQFKSYNDNFGHEEGNVALQSVTRVIRRVARQDDLVGRYGGEEFVSLMLIAPQAAVLAAERIRIAVEAECTPACNSLLQRQITVSIGLAVPQSGSLSPDALLDELIKVADHELYRAKRAGRNRVSASIDIDTTILQQPGPPEDDEVPVHSYSAT